MNTGGHSSAADEERLTITPFLILLKQFREQHLSHLYEKEIRLGCRILCERGACVYYVDFCECGGNGEGGMGEEEREREVFYLDHGLTVDLNHFVEPLSHTK